MRPSQRFQDTNRTWIRHPRMMVQEAQAKVDGNVEYAISPAPLCSVQLPMLIGPLYKPKRFTVDLVPGLYLTRLRGCYAVHNKPTQRTRNCYIASCYRMLPGNADGRPMVPVEQCFFRPVIRAGGFPETTDRWRRRSIYRNDENLCRSFTLQRVRSSHNGKLCDARQVFAKLRVLYL